MFNLILGTGPAYDKSGVMSHGQIRTPVAIKPLNLLSLAARIDVVAAPSPATSIIRPF
jgi:hypothetical protein